MSPARILLFATTSFLAGMWLGVVADVSQALLLVIVSAGAAVAVFCIGMRAVAHTVVYGAVVMAACASGAFISDIYKDGRIEQGNILRAYAGEIVSVNGMVVQYPDTRLNGARIVISVGAINGKEITQTGSPRILLYGSRYERFEYGDSLSVSGPLEEPRAFNGFNYPAFLAKDGIFAIMRNPDIDVRQRAAPSFAGILFSIRGRFSENVLTLVPQPQAALLNAMLTGDEGGLSDDFKTSLNRSGLRHIVAVSGMNITLIFAVVMSGLFTFGARRAYAIGASAIFIFLFVVMIGAPASALRAACFGVTMRLPEIFGRAGSALTITCAVAALMAAQNPYALVYDVGFQFSFAAIIGIILFTEKLQRVFEFIPRGFMIRESIAMSIAAQLAVVPIALYTFKIFSFIGPVSNLLVVPLVLPVTLAGIALSILHALLPAVAGIAALPLSFVLEVIMRISMLFDAAPVLSVSNTAVLMGGACLYGVALVYISARVGRTWPVAHTEEFNESYAK